MSWSETKLIGEDRGRGEGGYKGRGDQLIGDWYVGVLDVNSERQTLVANRETKRTFKYLGVHKTELFFALNANYN